MNAVQLANTYNPSKNYGVDFWYASPKFDGVRAIFIAGEGLVTRTHKPLHGFDTLVKALGAICSTNRLSFIDGELIIAGKTFQSAQGVILASEHPEKSKAEFHVFAVGGNFKNTQEMLNAIPHEPNAKIFKVESEIIPNNFQSIEKVCEKFIAQGYEGVVLRNPDKPYFEGRNDDLLKYKFFKEADLKVVSVNEKSVVVKGIFNGQKVKTNVKYCSGEKNLIGKILSVKFQSLTDRPNKDGFFSLRFPSAIGFKEDRDFSEEAIEFQTTNGNFAKKSSIVQKRYGFLEVGFQLSFVNKTMPKMSFIPTKAEMYEWKRRLFNCRNVEEGMKLIADLKLTIPKIMEFAKYLNVKLSGCKYLKAEIVRRLINASLGAKLRVEAWLRFVQLKKEVLKWQVIQVSEKLKFLAIPMKSTSCSGIGGNFLKFTRARRGSFLFLGIIPTIQTLKFVAIMRMKERSEIMANEIFAIISRIRAVQQKLNDAQTELNEAVEIFISYRESQSIQPVQNETSDRLLTARQVWEALQISESTFYEHLRTGLLPPGISFGPRSKRWRMSDIRAWQKERQNSDSLKQPITIVMQNAKNPAKRRGRPSRVKKLGEFCYV